MGARARERERAVTFYLLDPNPCSVCLYNVVEFGPTVEPHLGAHHPSPRNADMLPPPRQENTHQALAVVSLSLSPCRCFKTKRSRSRRSRGVEERGRRLSSVIR